MVGLNVSSAQAVQKGFQVVTDKASAVRYTCDALIFNLTMILNEARNLEQRDFSQVSEDAALVILHGLRTSLQHAAYELDMHIEHVEGREEQNIKTVDYEQAIEKALALSEQLRSVLEAVA
jgi:hypothetical protein